MFMTIFALQKGYNLQHFTQEIQEIWPKIVNNSKIRVNQDVETSSINSGLMFSPRQVVPTFFRIQKDKKVGFEI